MQIKRVVAAIICDCSGSTWRVFATARGYGEFKGLWEFPGGKIEDGETSEQALIREIEEELAVRVQVGELFCTVEYDYPEFHLSMDCFFCTIKSGEIVLREAEDARWLKADELSSVNWLPADKSLVEKLKSFLKNGK